jgi:hypothetical protein
LNKKNCFMERTKPFLILIGWGSGGRGGGPENWPDLVMVGRGIVPEKEQTEREIFPSIQLI